MKRSLHFLLGMIIVLLMIPSCNSVNSSVTPPSATIMKKEIQNIAELSTVKCKVHLNGTGEKTVKSAIDIFGKGWFSSDYPVVFGYDAEFEVGVTIDNVEIDETGQTVLVKLSEPKITRCEILKGADQEKEYPMIVYDKEEKIIKEKKQATLSERNEIRNDAEKMLRERLEETKPNFDLAEQTAKELISSYVHSVSDYVVEFQ